MTAPERTSLTRRTSPLLVAGFSALIVLILISGLALRQRVERIHAQVIETLRAYSDLDRIMAELRFQTLSLAIDFRDYLLEESADRIPERQANLIERHQQLLSALEDMDHLPASNSAAVGELRKQIDSYWDTINTVLHWRETRKDWIALIRSGALPGRQAILQQAARMASINRALLDERQNSLRDALNATETYLVRTLVLVLVLGVVISALTFWRTTQLEKRAELNRLDLERLSGELRRLSQELVRVQEAERKSLSRELHDEVGQMMTAMRMELGNAESFLLASPDQALAHMKSAAGLAEQTLRSVRSLARGLRPSMLDELGVGPALNWLAREFTRHTSIQVHLTADDSLDHLPESYRTCIYRVVQEALTNCARHAHATEILLDIKRVDNALHMSIRDNGSGFDVTKQVKGIGLLGMKERVKELDGELDIASSPGGGTRLKVQVPLGAGVLV
jgi:signal transduction histidine kinase